MPDDCTFYHIKPQDVIDAITFEGLLPTGRIQTLNSYENRVFEVEIEDGPAVIVKFYRPGRWDEEQILEEHRLVFQLSGRGFPACAPLVRADGSSLGRNRSGIFYAAWAKTAGRQPDELKDDDFRTLGRQLAELHNIASLETASARPPLDENTYGFDSLDFLSNSGLLPEHIRERYAAAVLNICEIYRMRSGHVPVHRIHGDCHLGNILRVKDGWAFLDFDDMCMGPAVQDLWMLFPGRDDETLRRRKILLDSYRIFRDFDDSWLSLVEPLRALRITRFSAWIGRRWEDPAFPRAFPDFASLEYWEQETDALEEQLDIITNPPALKDPRDSSLAEL